MNLETGHVCLLEVDHQSYHKLISVLMIHVKMKLKILFLALNNVLDLSFYYAFCAISKKTNAPILYEIVDL